MTVIKGFDTSNRSLTWIRKRSGPSIDPCGTPQIISRQLGIHLGKLCTVSVTKVALKSL